MGIALIVALTVAGQLDVDQLSPNPSPSARRSCGAAVEPVPNSEHVWCFGGFGGNFLGDLWMLDTATSVWAPVTSTNPPSARDSHMFTFAGRPILFGGFHMRGIQLEHLNDLYALDTATSAWTQLTQSTAKPSPRGFASFEFIPHRNDVILFGGWDVSADFFGRPSGGFFNDVWRLSVSGTAGTWTNPATTGTPPSARAATCSAYDEARHKLVVFGGQTGYDANNNPAMSDETWELDVDTLAWTLVNAATPPSPRAFCATTYDSGEQRVILYSGQGGADGDTLLLDAYSYDGAAWEAEPFVDIDAGVVDSPSFAYSPTLGRAVMFGGRIQSGASSVYGDSTWTLDLERSPPTANAGPDQSVDETALVTLDGSASNDPDGTALQFAWTQTSGPTVTLSSATAARPTFTAPTVTAADAVVFQLTVSDGFYTATDSVRIAVNDALNDAPVAQAGVDLVAVEANIVTLDGSASVDPDGTPLAFHWTQVSGPAVVLDDPTSPAPRFTAPPAGAQLSFALEVDDGQLTDTDFVNVVVTTSSNAPPVADAGADVDTSPGSLVTLDGSASNDPNGTPLAFQWTQLGGPHVTLDDDTAARPVFDAPVSLSDVVITFELVVNDGVFSSAADVVTIRVVAALGPPRVASVARTIAVVGAPYAYDDDDGSVAATGSGTTFTLVDGPPGMSVDAVTGLVSWLPDVEGPTPVEIAARNASGEDVQDFVVDVFAPPVITSTPSTTFNVGANYSYDEDDTPQAEGSGDIRWSLLEGPSGMVVDVATGKITWFPVLDRVETVRLRAQSAFGSDEQDFVLERPADTLPHIRRNANPFAAVGRPYMFDGDDRVDVDNALPGDVVVILPREPLPPGFLLAEIQRYILWVPPVAGTFTITLDLVTPLGIAVDSYTYDVTVSDLGDDLAAAAATASPATGPAPLTVTFDGSSSHGSKGSPLWLSYWNTGDGSFAGSMVDVGQQAPMTAEYTYTVPGSYTAALETWDPYGVFARDKLTISVLDGDKQPPTARINADVLEGHDQLTVHLGCDCVDPDGHLAGVQWSYGDGSFATELSPTHTYVHPGNYHVRVTAFDEDGLTGTDDVDVRVRDGDLAPPMAHIAATPAEGDQPMNVTLTADVADDDGTVVDVKWSLPDGTQRTGASVDTVFATPGYYPVLLSATDNDGLVGRDVLTISVRADGVRAPRVVSTADTAAVVGQAWHYDADDRASAQGGRPIGWRIGKDLNGKKIGAPEGLSIDFDSGLVTWTPTAAQAGEQHIVIVAENGAGADLQEFDVHVEAAAVGGGCGCSSSTSSGAGNGAMLLTLLAALALVARKKNARAPAQNSTRQARNELPTSTLRSAAHRRVDSRTSFAACRVPFFTFVVCVCGAALTSGAAHAQATGAASVAPTITSTPTTTARVGQLYDAPLPQADGEPPFAWALGAAPAGMVIDNVDGRLLWMPTSAGAVDVDLLVVDRNGSGEQRFTIETAAGTKPTLGVNDPEGGYVFRTDEIGTLTPGQYLVPVEGDLPMQFSSTRDGCMFVTPNGIAIVHQAFTGTCQTSIDVVNPWGVDHRDITINFVEPPDSERILIPSLTATPIEGAAPLLVSFDGTASKMPDVGGGFAVASFIWPGDGAGIELGATPDTLVAEHLYEQPGTYEAALELVARDEAVERATFTTRATVVIIVDEAESRPPAPSITADVSAGKAPLSVRFASRTLQGDAPIAAYTVDFGDGDRFEAAFSDFGGFDEPTPSHTYARPGSYTATVTVVDTLGRSGVATADVLATAVEGSPPVARILAFPSRGEVPLTVQLDSEKNDLDGYVVRATWLLPDGTVSGADKPTITLSEPGDHVVELVVADDDGLETHVRAVITATKEGTTPPKVVSTPNTRAIAGQPWSYDADGVISVTGGGPYDFSLGKTLAGKLVNAPAGMILDARAGKLTWTPGPDVVGEVPVSVVVQNAAGSGLHEFILVVSSGKPKVNAPASCASVSDAAPPFGALALLLSCVSSSIARRRRRLR